MFIISDSQITNADITATNSLSFANTEKLQIYQLDNKFKASQGTTQIVLDFGANIPDVNSVALCGSNISASATLSLSYSSSAPGTPEATISLPSFSSFNQIWILDNALNKRYWVIDITDPDPQGGTGVEIGYIYIGEGFYVDFVAFPHVPTLNVVSAPSTTATGQEYGDKILNQYTMEFSADFTDDELADILEVIAEKQNIDPVVIVPFEESISSRLYPPKYGVLSSDSYSYPMVNNPGHYELALTHRETF